MPHRIDSGIHLWSWSTFCWRHSHPRCLGFENGGLVQKVLRGEAMSLSAIGGYQIGPTALDPSLSSGYKGHGGAGDTPFRFRVIGRGKRHSSTEIQSPGPKDHREGLASILYRKTVWA
jgi:hypothetical protein